FSPFPLYFNDTVSTEIYTLSLHDALPISVFLYLQMTAGKKYLIDFTVTGEKFFVSDSGNLKETFSGTHHVLIIYEGSGTPMIARSEEHTLNSSHRTISYAVFCLKKKTKNK